ncbi:lytic murein transglycosylase [Phaeobacter gallaeciensis]|uniref:lytic murein transglycosylase n=1 Tax=Phaeobacter gallaeciensis TaxID=60890 RepID=UPI00237F77B1|nr:lytic murein transglycosylase [Phaeobacter gallaeciensis]MDE4097334.1 lytic murein transglycosylase [Phaeobacter gallaeciensis]MDE4106152.1 lytic murein transglycosylase [Phaeobacter gallaeciensis]MDE4110598.1 lytic murein transglycosylase [Phaeobacter gallaeciensis]MDE4115069.1 lytic murein transglycosylase [Phaeobacter gallaeciensis]MDE4119538.1 lytic murein transglycosylase [Phaeobacter gallaeciensis]
MVLRALLVVFLLLGGLGSALAQDHAAIERQFQTWLRQEVWPQARQVGVSRRTFKAAFDGVTLNWKLPDLVPPGAPAKTPKTQRQAEFGKPGKYFGRGTVDGATATGRQMARRHKASLTRVERETGVPGRIILAIWGRESAYGRAAIPHDAFQVLATKGFMSTRADYFSAELIAALQIAEAGHVPAHAMKSSWAGALGQPQFMPTNFLQHAVDGDGDGRADIWGSEADTIASIGTYLKRHGWQTGRDWGFEVSVPGSVSCTLEGPDQGRLISDWEEMGITRVSGRPFPEHERGQQGYLLMPAGRYGPAFVVTPNFYVLKDYNMSDLYALFVGHVGDRIQFGVGDFHARWGSVGGLLRSDVAAMQRTLIGQGHDVGGADGLAGYKTRRSIGRWQEATGQSPTCFPDPAMKAALAR